MLSLIFVAVQVQALNVKSAFLSTTIPEDIYNQSFEAVHQLFVCKAYSFEDAPHAFNKRLLKCQVGILDDKHDEDNEKDDTDQDATSE